MTHIENIIARKRAEAATLIAQADGLAAEADEIERAARPSPAGFIVRCERHPGQWQAKFAQTINGMANELRVCWLAGMRATAEMATAEQIAALSMEATS